MQSKKKEDSHLTKQGALDYSRVGSGSPLVLIHGLLGGSFCWRFNIPVLSQQHATLALDLPGFGEQPTPADTDCGMQTTARRILAWVEQQQLESVDIVGASWGGAVALLLAAMTPRVRSLVLAAPVNPWSDFGRRRVRFFSSGIGAAILRLGIPFSGPIHKIGLERMYGDPRRIPAGTLAGYSRMLKCKGRAGNLISTLRSWESDLRALAPAIERVKVPTLLIWGTRDGAVDLRSSEVLLSTIPGSERTIIDGAGHLPFEETPAEFNRLILGFLERVSPESQPAIT